MASAALCWGLTVAAEVGGAVTACAGGFFTKCGGQGVWVGALVEFTSKIGYFISFFF